MTCIAAVCTATRTIFASDTETNYGGTRLAGARKVRRATLGGGPALLGADGHGGLLPIVLAELEALDAAGPGDPAPDDPDEYQRWADRFAMFATRAAAEATPPILSDDGSTLDGTLLVATPGRMFYVFTHQALVVEPPLNGGPAIAALGSGTDVALATMRAALRHGADNYSNVIREALYSAAQYAPGVNDAVRLTELAP